VTAEEFKKVVRDERHLFLFCRLKKCRTLYAGEIMKRCLFCSFLPTLLVVFCVAAAYAQNASQPQLAQKSANAGHHGSFTVELVKPLDSKKLKAGDPVEAKLTGGITLPSGAQVSSGTMVVGHVTLASARSKSDAESSLGISFDKIVRPGGEETPIKGVLQAMAPNPNSDITSGNNGVDYGNTLRSVMAPGGATGGDRTHPPLLTEDSTGVLGFKNMKLDNGVLTSTNKEVKLDAGTRFLLNVTIQ
jgi:hypothetical protein